MAKTTAKKKPAKKKRLSKKVSVVLKDLVLPDLSRYFLIFSVVVTTILMIWVISPFFTVLVYAALIAIIFHPLQKRLVKLLWGNNTIAALVSTFIVILLFLIPLTLFIIFLGMEAVDTYPLLEASLTDFDYGAFDINKVETFPVIGEQLFNLLERTRIDEVLEGANIDLLAAVRDIIQNISTFLVNQSAALLRSVGDTMISIMFMILTLFFFFKDGEYFREYLKMLSPLPREYEDAIEKKLKETTYGMVVGGFGTSIIQGIMGGIGFAIAGLDHAIFYGTVMAFASLIPYVGSSVIWAPTALAVILSGSTGWGVFLGLWGLFVISNIDNLVRPFLIGTSARMHPFATFIVVMGGLFVFGLHGIIFGPLILSLALSIYHIYQMEYKEVLDH